MTNLYKNSGVRERLTKQREKELRQQADPKRNPSAGFVGAWLRELLAEIDALRHDLGLAALELDAHRRESAAASERADQAERNYSGYGAAMQEMRQRAEAALAELARNEALR